MSRKNTTGKKKQEQQIHSKFSLMANVLKPKNDKPFKTLFRDTRFVSLVMLTRRIALPVHRQPV